KLCRVIVGEALDVVADIRVGSPTFGKYAAVLLSAEKRNELYVPAGFAHGFVALSDPTEFLYKCSDFYDPTDEYGIRWNDPTLKIPWPIADPLVPEKDGKLPLLQEVAPDQLPRYSAA